MLDLGNKTNKKCLNKIMRNADIAYSPAACVCLQRTYSGSTLELHYQNCLLVLDVVSCVSTGGEGG